MLIGATHFWQGGALHGNIGLELANTRITAIRALGDDTPDISAHLVTAPFTDLQVNGGGGVMVNSQPTPDGLRAIAAAHHRLGTGTILPTVITDSADIIEAAGEAALAVMDDPRIGGLHIEGPHIAPERRGTHAPKHIRPLDDTTVGLVERLRARGLRVMITLAPELANPGLFARLVGSGAVVSGGHSAATAAQTRAALGAGLGCFTHLYNAMPPMASRAPGILGAALDTDVPAGIIVDGIHVDWTMLRIALRRPGPTFVVSDAMATVGGPDHFTLYGQTIAVKDGALFNSEGSLAGAHIDMRTSLANLVTHVGLPLAKALPMVDDIPRRVMGLPPATIGVGTATRDILALSNRFEVLSTL